MSDCYRSVGAGSPNRAVFSVWVLYRPFDLLVSSWNHCSQSWYEPMPALRWDNGNRWITDGLAYGMYGDLCSMDTCIYGNVSLFPNEVTRNFTDGKPTGVLLFGI